MENLVALLIFLPFLLALFPALISNEKVRGLTVYIGGAIIAVCAVVTAFFWFADGGTMVFDLPGTEMTLF